MLPWRRDASTADSRIYRIGFGIASAFVEVGVVSYGCSRRGCEIAAICAVLLLLRPQLANGFQNLYFIGLIAFNWLSKLYQTSFFIVFGEKSSSCKRPEVMNCF